MEALTLWFVIVGLVLVTMALTGSVLKRLPLSSSMLYLGLGLVLGPSCLGLVRIDPLQSSKLMERVTEIAVIISLFTAGMKLRVPLRDPQWGLPLRLAVVSMALTVGMVAVVGTLVGLPLGAAVLLGAILAPTDPVLASDVQVEDATDRDKLRFGLTGEAGFNDGTAFPFVMLGLGLMGLHSLGPFGLKWLGVDLLWAVFGALALGGLAGWGVGHLVLYVRKQHQEAVGLDEFLALGLIALTYGAALAMHTYGFLAVFAAGVALRHVELSHTKQEEPQVSIGPGEEEAAATDPKTAPAFMAHAVLSFNEQLERIGEVAVVILLGAMLSTVTLRAEALWLVPALLLIIRPVSVYLGLAGAELTGEQRRLTAWFGIRGVGSIYYLMYAVEHGVPAELGRVLVDLTLTVVAVSIVVHGISVTPLMQRYSSPARRRAQA